MVAILVYGVNSYCLRTIVWQNNSQEIIQIIYKKRKAKFKRKSKEIQ